MDWISTEKKDGYSIWLNSNNESYLVVDGLDPSQIHHPGVIESFMTSHYDVIALLYWCIIATTFIYILLQHVYHPLKERIAAGKALFSDE